MPPRSSPGNGRSPVHQMRVDEMDGEGEEESALFTRGVTVQGAPPAPMPLAGGRKPAQFGYSADARQASASRMAKLEERRRGLHGKSRAPAAHDDLSETTSISGYGEEPPPASPPVSERKSAAGSARDGAAAAPQVLDLTPGNLDRHDQSFHVERRPSQATGMWSELKEEATIEDPEERAAIMGRTLEKQLKNLVPSAAQLKAAPAAAPEVVVRDLRRPLWVLLLLAAALFGAGAGAGYGAGYALGAAYVPPP